MGTLGFDPSPLATAPTLEARHLSKEYRGKPAVRDLSFSVAPGEIMGLLGPNGAGKTTTFSMLVGSLAPDSGGIFLAGEDITSLPMHLRARQGMGYLPQESSVFRRMSVLENLLCILEARKTWKGSVNGDPQAEDILKRLGLAALKHRRAESLSGGERRRLELARALVIQPKFLLLDEPFVGIDPITVSEIQRILRELATAGLGLVLTDHHVRETLEVTDRAIILYDGAALLTGTARELLESEEARRLYLGEKFKM